MRLTLCLVLGLAALAAAYDEHEEPKKEEYVKDDKVYKSTNKEYKDELDEELHKSYDTDGKEVHDLSDHDYEPPKKEELVEHEEDDGDYPAAPPKFPMLPPWLFQQFPFGFPPFPFPFYPPPPGKPGQPGPPHGLYPPPPPRYLTPIEQEDGEYPPEHPVAAQKKRERRGAPELLKVVTVKDDSEWWHDVDSQMEGERNEVSDYLMSKTGYATWRKIDKQMDYFSPVLHYGTINRGYFAKPEFEAPGDRSFGKGMDFNKDEMDAFKFTPHGQHIALDMDHLEDYLKNGKLPIGRRFIVRPNLVTGYSKCWTGVHTKTIHYQEYVDVFSASAREDYWREFNCKAIVPGKYVLVGLKKSVEINHHDHAYNPYKSSNYVLFLKSTDAHAVGLGYIAISDFDPLGLQEASPVRLNTAKHVLDSVADYDGKSFGTRKYMFAQPNVPQLYNHQDTFTGTKIGVTDYKLGDVPFAPYESNIYGTATGVGIHGPHDEASLLHGNVLHQPYYPVHKDTHSVIPPA